MRQKLSFPLRKIRQYLALVPDYLLLRSSRLFDKNWYLKNNPDVAQVGMDAAWHYLTHGGFEGRDPSSSFGSRWYLDTYEDVRAAGMNPLVHYLKRGQKEGRGATALAFGFNNNQESANLQLIRTSGFFDEDRYLEENPDVAQAGIDPLLHYLLYGGFEGRDLPPYFFSQWYLDTYEDVKESGVNPLVHYLKLGRNEGREATPPVLELRRMYDYSKQANGIVFEDSPEQVYLQSPKVIGSFSGILLEGVAMCPRPYISVVEDAVIFWGESLVIVENKIVLSDEMVDFPGREFGKKTSRIKMVHEGGVMFRENKKPSMYVKEGVCLSCGHDSNYFHWLVECLPKLLLLDSLDLFQDVPLLIPAGLHPNLMAALERLNTHNRPIIYIEQGAACQVDRLIYPSELSRILDRYEGSPVFNQDIVLSHKWLTKVSDQLKNQVSYDGKPWRKLFLSRRKGLRVLGNHEQVEQLLRNQGFEIVEVDGLSLDFQIKLFSEASLVVAPTGAALTNMLFCQPGTKVIIFMSSHEVTNFYFWTNLGAINNLDITILSGERLFNLTDYYSVHDDYVVDTQVLSKEIETTADEHQKSRLIKRQQSSEIVVEQNTPDAIKKGTKIFVVGPPRSGTTLIYRMMAKEWFLPECTFVSTLMKVFDEMYKYSDDERFSYYAHNLTNLAEIFKKPIFDLLYAAAWKVSEGSVNRFIYKDPILTLYLEYFSLFFGPTYKVVFCLRDPRDVVSSMFQVLKKESGQLDDAALFDQAIRFIFPFYQVIHHIDNTTGYIDRDKIIFVKYEDLVNGDQESIKNLEDFLGFTLNSQNAREYLNRKLDKTSSFYSENYEKDITTQSVGRYRNSLTDEQIVRIEHVFSYSMARLNYR